MSGAELGYSPKLKEAMAEIKAVLARHDIAGHILLHEPGFSEYLLAISPTWSLLKLENGGVRVRSKAKDFGGNLERQRLSSEATASLVRHFADLLAMDADFFEQIYAMLAEHWDMTHCDGKHTPHQNH